VPIDTVLTHGFVAVVLCLCECSGEITDMYAAGVIQPMLVSCSAIKLATECVGMILKIDDVVAVM
jgi:chaperonin GroEL (HSP60 family)